LMPPLQLKSEALFPAVQNFKFLSMQVSFMFYLIGIGLKPEQLTLEAASAIEKCGRVFLDAYTSAYSQGTVKDLREVVGKEILCLGRKGIEQDFELVLKNAKEENENVALLVFGNALSATTHIQLLLDAKKLGLPFKVIPGISIYNLLGGTGLDQYRFGRTCTIVEPKPGYEPDSFYSIIESNFKNGLHTLCLLDIDAEQSKMMSVAQALALLKKIEKKKGKGVLKKAVLVGLYGLGNDNQKAKQGGFEALSKTSFALFPQSLVVAAPLNEKEKEAVEALNG